jgi:hypothetical protein
MPGRLVFSTTADDANSPTERLRIASNGSVTIGKTSNAAKGLEVYQASDAAIRIQNNASGTGSNDGILLELSGSSTDALIWNYESANMRFGTAGTERLRIQSAGGISFNGDTAAANALDDYEEGTWTATAEYGSGGFQSCSNNVCRYVKVGNLVQISGRFSLNTHTGSSGELRIGGLPFAKGDPTNDGNADGIAIYIEGAASNITNSISGLVLDTQTVFFVRRSGTTASGNDMSGLTDSGTTLLVGGTYSLVGD